MGYSAYCCTLFKLIFFSFFVSEPASAGFSFYKQPMVGRRRNRIPGDSSNFCSENFLHLRQEKIALNRAQSNENGPVVQLDRISDFGSEGWGFESSLGHQKQASACFFVGISCTFILNLGCMKQVEHIGIAVKDLDQAIDHFSSLLNTPCYKTEEVESQQVTTAFFN